VLSQRVRLLLELVESPLGLKFKRMDGRGQVGDELEALALLAGEGGALDRRQSGQVSQRHKRPGGSQATHLVQPGVLTSGEAERQ